MFASLLLTLAFAPPETGAPTEADVQAILADCTMCHDASDDVLNLEAPPSSLIGKASTTGTPLIVPGNPTGSYLYMKMVGAEGIEGETMPMGEDPLPVEKLTAVRDWIAGLASPGPSEPGDTGDTGDTGDIEDGGEEPGPGPSEPAPAPKPRRKKPFYGTHQINLQTTTTNGKRVIAYRIHHRFGRVGKPGDRNYLGMAGGVIMSMGVEYGIIDGLDAMVRWSNSGLDWELGMKYVPVRQEDGMPVSFGMYASFEALTELPARASNRYTGNFQVMLSRLWFERWSTQLTVNYSLLTNHAPSIVADLGNGPVPVTDNRGTLDAGLASTVWLGKKRKHGIDLEYILPIPAGDTFYYHGGDVNPNGTKIGAWALGWSAKAGLHLFQVFVSNTRNIHTNLVAPGGDTKNPFKPFGDFFFGFNISRQWKL
ncbi:DUF5777 family beta-barrel protein [Nannocystaceae bacterium ST9]